MKKHDENNQPDNNRYAVPTNVNACFELFKGFGLREILLCLGAAAVVGALSDQWREVRASNRRYF